jgi:citrate lyase subunit beta/citryl-CoA lyase
MSDSVRPRRSALYVPGSNERAVAKAATIPADVLIFDLEDSVSEAGKEAARAAVAAAILAQPFGGGREVVVRINHLDSPWAARDIAALVSIGPDALLIPKVSRTDDIRRARAAMAAAGAPKSVKLWARIETPAGVLNAGAIAGVAAMPPPALTAFVIGANDLVAAIGAPVRLARATARPHLAPVVLAARAYGLAVLDGTFNDIADRKGLLAECREARTIGMDGKTLIHPTQVPVANQAFAPDEEEIAWAEQVVAAFAEPANAGVEVMALAGRMVERLHERTARRTLALAAAIAARDDPAAPEARLKATRPPLAARQRD